MDDAAIRRALRSRRLVRLYRGVYALSPRTTLTREGQDLAAVWACGDRALLCGLSAAVHWDMLRFGPALPQVIVRGTGRRTIAGLDLRVTRDLLEDERTVRNLVPVTTPGRTLIELAGERTISERALESAAAQAERDGHLPRSGQLLLAARARDRTGSARLRKVLRVGPRLWRSDEEAAAAAAIVAAGLPEPVIAHRVATAAGLLELDLSFPPYRVILEDDGGQHALILSVARDVDRDAALELLGWVTVRVTATAVRADARAAVRAVRPALVTRGWRA